MMYQVIRRKPTARQLYADKLVAEKVLAPMSRGHGRAVPQRPG